MTSANQIEEHPRVTFQKVQDCPCLTCPQGRHIVVHERGGIDSCAEDCERFMAYLADLLVRELEVTR